MTVYYFGCLGEPGHYLWKPDGWKAGWYPFTGVLPTSIGPKIDGNFCPKGPEVQGQALLHHLDGWTILAFWDRSVDKRPGCNSSFIFEGILTGDEALESAKTAFPFVWRRFSFDVTLPALSDDAQGRKHG